MAKQYRLTSNTRFGAAGETVTEQHLKDNNADLDDLRKRKLVEAAADSDDDDGPVTDEANKLRIEERIRAESVRLNRPLEEHEKNKVAAEVTAESADQTKDATKQAAKDQRQENAAASKRDATQPPKK